MMQIKTQLVVQSILMFMGQCSNAILPQWVYRVESCPDSNKFSEWVEASKRLNCFHDLTSTAEGEQEKVYHCLPSSYLNETLEFCGRNIPVAPGYCPIYNYHQKTISYQPTYYRCRRFTSGCPKTMYHSKNVYLHPDCLKIDRVSKCYIADMDCPNITTTPRSKTVTVIEATRHTTTMSTVIADNSESLDSVHEVKMTNGGDSNKRIIYIAVSLAVLVVASLVIVIFRKRIIGLYKYLISTSSGTISEDEVLYLSTGRLGDEQTTVPDTHSLQSSRDSATGSMEIEHSKQAGYHESAERVSLLDNMYNGATMGQYNLLLRSLAKHITRKEFLRIKDFVKDRREMNDNDLEEIKGSEELLDYLDKKYLVLNNIVYLQGLFLACKAPHLYDRCLEYAKKRGKEITYFEAKILKSDHTKVKYVINCPKISEYKISELEKLRSTVATLIHANFDDILVSGVKNGCVIVTMMIRNCLIPTLKTLSTSEKMSMTCQSLKYKIIKVMIRDEIVYPRDILLNTAELAAEEKLGRHVLRSSFEAQIEISKTNDLNGTISSALECKQKKENVEDGVLSKDVEITPQNAHALNDFTSFLERIGGRITDDTWHCMKIRLHDFVDHECVGKMNPSKMLNELAKLLKLEYNMSFLEWIFDECGENKLAKECLEFSAENQFPLECFNTNYTPCGESQPFEIQLMVFELETYRDELQDLRYWLAKIIHVHPGQILMTALRNGPVVVTFLMREKHGNAILEYLRTDDGQIAASRKRIKKIVQNGNVIEIGKALNGSNFVQIRLRLRENSSGIHAPLRNLASIILRRTGISMEGSEIYTRTVPCDKKRNEANAGPLKEESFIKKNRNLILEEIEPRDIEKSPIADLFHEEKLASMRKIKGRRDQAKYFLKLCESLPEEERERACSYLKRTVSLPEEKSNHEELSSIKKCIQQNKENILDEIDSDFIESTIYRMEDAPEEFKTAWSDPNKSRKEKATIFLDFALQKDECIRALKDLMDEKGIKDPE